MGKILLAVVAVLGAFAWRLYYELGIGKTVYNHRPGVCRQVHGPAIGTEDLELIRSEGFAFATSGVLPKRAHGEGKIFLYDFNQKMGSNQLEAVPIPIKGSSHDQKNFHPHGFSHWVVNGVIRLYVINHNEGKHSIEVFDYDPTGPALIHKKSIKHPTLVRPNGIVAVGPDQFMWTNDGVAQNEVTYILEILFAYNAGTVYFWDVKESHMLLSGMGGPNGIAYDQKNNKLFITELNYNRIHAYDLSKDKTKATLFSTVNLYSACDNLFIDADGSLYSGCHPILHQTAKALGDPEADITSASQILRIKFDKDYKTAAISEPYSNDGKEVSGSSVSIVYNNQMLIGTVCKGLLHCEITHPSTL